jgi:hypothetical protein
MTDPDIEASVYLDHRIDGDVSRPTREYVVVATLVAIAVLQAGWFEAYTLASASAASAVVVYSTHWVRKGAYRKGHRAAVESLAEQLADDEGER